MSSPEAGLTARLCHPSLKQPHLPLSLPYVCVFLHLPVFINKLVYFLCFSTTFCIAKYVSCMFQNQCAFMSIVKLVLPLIEQTIALSNSCFTCFKRGALVGIRADQAAAQRTTRLTVTSKHRGLSPNCLVKMITAKRETEEQRLPSLLLLRHCCRALAPDKDV